MLNLVIPFYNDEHFKNSFEKLTNLDDFSKIKIIIVDDSSNEKYKKELAIISKKYKNIKIITHERNENRWNTIADGFNSAKEEIVARTDADSFFRKDWFKTVKETFGDKAVIAAGGPHLNYVDNIWAKVGSWLSNISTKPKTGQSIILNGSGIVVRNSVLKELKGIDRKMKHSEDFDLSIRLSNYARKNNKKIVFDERLCNYTHYPASLIEELKRRFRWGRGRYYIYKKHKSIGLDFYQKLGLLVGLVVSVYFSLWITGAVFLAPVGLTFLSAVKNRNLKIIYLCVASVLIWIRIVGLVAGCLCESVTFKK